MQIAAVLYELVVQDITCRFSTEEIDLVGREVGTRYAEQFMCGRPLFSEELEVIKCICREFWPLVNAHRSPIENLKTNHQGTYVLGWKGDKDPSPMAVSIIVGFLSSLGVQVSATVMSGTLHLTRKS